MNSGITIERRRIDCNSLPKGWQREEVLRKSGLSAGKVDVYYYSPTGKKIISKPQLARQLGDAVDISTFDFQTGKTIPNIVPPSISLFRCESDIPACGSMTATMATTTNVGTPPTYANSTITNNTLKRKYKQTSSTVIHSSNAISPNGSNASTTNLRHQLELSRALRTDVSLVPPIRQTASIFKQPVTVVHNHENTKIKTDAKQGNQEKPKQLFWEKRLERLRACHSTGEEFDNIGLPKGLKSVGPNVNEQTVLQSLATALHVLNTPITGQTSSKTELNKNTPAFMNPDQPLMQSILISEDDIRRQEERVNAARKKLQEALKV